jgi:YD repeat-containing protein
MTKGVQIKMLFGLFLALLTSSARAAQLAPGEVRYIVTLKPGASVSDLNTLGGRIESRDGASLTVVVPAVAVPTLAESAAVASVVEATDKPLSRRLTTLTTVPLWSTGQYVYDGAGNITAIGTVAAPSGENKTSTFTYDAASRLTAASIGRTAGDVSETYTYDGFGNLATHARTSPNTITYAPAPSYVDNRMTEAGIHYDEAGNVDNLGGTRPLTYDGFNQVTSQTLGSNTYNYIYDVNEERVGIQYGTTTHWTIRNFDNKR